MISALYFLYFLYFSRRFVLCCLFVHFHLFHLFHLFLLFRLFDFVVDLSIAHYHFENSVDVDVEIEVDFEVYLPPVFVVLVVFLSDSTAVCTAVTCTSYGHFLTIDEQR